MNTTNPGIMTEDLTETNTKLGPMYRVLLHNDDVNDVVHVTHALMEVFKFNSSKATNIMLEAHTTGVGLCAVEYLEHAELHQEQLQAFGLTATIEPDG